MNYIHPKAIVHPSAVLGQDNFIGPFCLIGPQVVMGNHNRFEAYVSVGQPAEHRDHFEKFGKVDIGSHNVVREFCTINGGTPTKTVMGERCVMLRGSHLSHDSLLEDDVMVSCNVLIGGDSYVMKGANLGLGAILHQYSVIGSYSMLGMGTIVTKSSVIEPGNIYVGNPAKFLKMNDVGLSRAGMKGEALLQEMARHGSLRKVYRK